MVTVYRGVLEKPIVFEGSIIITAENLNSIDFDKVIYYEVSPEGAMGNEGGILIYVLKDEDNLITYENNVSIDKELCDATLGLLDQKANPFISYSGGMGNYVYIKKDIQLEIDEKYGCFWYHSRNTKLRIDSSVKGVFEGVVAGMKSQNEE